MLGDGTFGFHSSEIDTAVRHGLAYVAVVGNDACWNAEYQIQLRSYGAPRAHGLDLLPTRYDRVAEGFGAHGEHVERPAELVPALQRAAGVGRAACVNVMIERLPAPVFRRQDA
jgi:acetolactate synthase-1/2/3 large subunit